MSTTLCPLSETVMNASGTWSLADRNNTTNLDTAHALDFIDQYGSTVGYERNLQNLYENSLSELKDLQSKARERAPYNTNVCSLKPMYPTWNAKQPCTALTCELNMHPVCLGGTACSPPNTFYAGINYQSPLCMAGPQLPSYAEDDSCDSDVEDGSVDVDVVVTLQEEDDSDDTPDQSNQSNQSNQPKPIKRLSSNMMRALMGVAYDLNHWKDLPPQKSRLSTGKTLEFVVGRDNRPLYIVMLIAMFVFIMAIMVGIVCLTKKAHHRHKRNKVLKNLKEKAYLQYQMQNLQNMKNVAPSLSQPGSLMGGTLRKW